MSCPVQASSSLAETDFLDTGVSGLEFLDPDRDREPPERDPDRLLEPLFERERERDTLFDLERDLLFDLQIKIKNN